MSNPTSNLDGYTQVMVRQKKNWPLQETKDTPNNSLGRVPDHQGCGFDLWLVWLCSVWKRILSTSVSSWEVVTYLRSSGHYDSSTTRDTWLALCQVQCNWNIVEMALNPTKKQNKKARYQAADNICLYFTIKEKLSADETGRCLASVVLHGQRLWWTCKRIFTQE